MWASFWQSLGEAFKIIGSGNPLMNEVVATTMKMAVTSSIISFLIGAPLGLLLATYNFKGKKVLVIICRTLMGLPPVAIGILVYLLFRGIGPFGQLRLIFTVTAMIIAQVLLITPVVVGMVETSAESTGKALFETRRGIGLGSTRTFLLMANENKYQLIAAYLFAFARATAEVGAVQIVGGNILHKTMVMTTYIALNYNTGNLEFAVALGIIIIAITLGFNLVGGVLQLIGSRKKKR
ncbi:MAG: ABC transporter permease [Clostridia bacterium]|nr:ABC transporter permease [Clostridia bacterium]